MAIGFTVPNITDRKVIPDKNMTRSSTPRVLMQSFGDGYEQRLVQGINNITEEYAVSFVNRAKAEADDIMAFFDTNGGATAFDFTIPDTNSTSTTTSVLAAAPIGSLTLSLTAANLDIVPGATLTGTGVDAIGGQPVVTENQAPSAVVIVDQVQPIDNGTTLTFTNPNEKTIKVVCDEYSLVYAQVDNYTISCTFRRVYEP